MAILFNLKAKLNLEKALNRSRASFVEGKYFQYFYRFTTNGQSFNFVIQRNIKPILPSIRLTKLQNFLLPFFCIVFFSNTSHCQKSTIYLPENISKKEARKYKRSINAIHKKGFSVTDRRKAYNYIKLLVNKYPDPKWGDAYFHMGTWSEKEKNWEKAVVKKTKYERPYKMMADYYFQKEEFVKYLNLTPNYDSSKQVFGKMKANFELYKNAKNLIERKKFISEAKKYLDETGNFRKKNSYKEQIDAIWSELNKNGKQLVALSDTQYQTLKTFNNEEWSSLKNDLNKNRKIQEEFGTNDIKITLNQSSFYYPYFKYNFGHEVQTILSGSQGQKQSLIYCSGDCNLGLLNGLSTLRSPGEFIMNGQFKNGVLNGPAIIKTGWDLIYSNFINGVANGKTLIFRLNEYTHVLSDIPFNEIWDVDILKKMVVSINNSIVKHSSNKLVLDKLFRTESYFFFTGNLIDGKANGKGIHVSNNDLHVEFYKGNFKNGYRNGEGELLSFKIVRVLEDKELDDLSFKGRWKDGVLIEKSELKINGKAIKTCEGDCENGKGKLIYTNGDTYDGSFIDGKRNGNGTYVWNQYKDKYTGEWKDNKQHGYGVLENGVKGLFGNNKKGYWVNGSYYGQYPPKDYSKYFFEFSNILKDTYWYNINDGNKNVFRLQVTTSINDDGSIDIRSFLGKEFSISGTYNPFNSTLFKNGGDENNIPDLRTAIERLIKLKLNR